MKRMLKIVEYKIWHYANGEKINGPHDRVRGDLSGVRGEISGVRGEISNVWGDLDDCEISDEDRKNGIDIKNLVEEK